MANPLGMAQAGHLEAILRDLPVGIIVLDAASGDPLFGNARMAEIFRCSPLPPPNTDAADYYYGFHPDGRRYQRGDWPAVRALAGEVVVGEEIDILRGDETCGAIRVDAAPVRGPDGSIVASVAVIADITDSKDREKALRVSEERHRAVTGVTSDYAYTARVEVDGRVVLEWASDTFSQVTGYSVSEWEAKGGWLAFTHPDDLPHLLERMQSRLMRGLSDEGEMRIFNRSGAIRWIRFSSQPVWDSVEKRVTRFHGATVDITDKKEAEERLREYANRLQTLTERLIEVEEQERRHLARELHDEVGQLLTGLNYSLEAAGRLPLEASRARLAEAQTLVRDLAGRVRDLSLRLRPSMLDDLGLVPALLWLLERYTTQTGVRVDFEHHGVSGRLPSKVETAAYRVIQEALTNVARHAHVDEAVVRLWAGDGMLIVHVGDRGLGFDRAVLATRGTGGLSGMEERIRLLGGHMEIYSQPGGGTRVMGELPLYPSREGGHDVSLDCPGR